MIGLTLGLLLLWMAADWYVAKPHEAIGSATYVGRQACAQCHSSEEALWTGSHHDRAMEIATEESVLGNFGDSRFTRQGITTRFFRDGDRFMVNTEGPDGEHHDYEVKYTFGVTPLQQYMVEFPDGRVQVLRVSWDTLKKEWFYVTPGDVPTDRILPGDPLHWTGLGQNWNTMCAECHSTDYHKNYDVAKDEYHSEFFEIDVSCEACHGPGSVHVELAEDRWLFWDRNLHYGLSNTMKQVSNQREVETCAPCHSRRSQIHPNYHAGASYFDHFDPSLLDETLYHADGQILDEVYVYGSFVQSRMYHEGVRCTDCHDPHSLKLKFPGNLLCVQCHQEYDSPKHHKHVSSAVGSPETQCVNCHMPSRTYMNIDDRRDHSLRVPRPDLSVELGTPNACNDCHTEPNEDAAWAAAKVREWYGEKRPDEADWKSLSGAPAWGVTHWAKAFDAGRKKAPGAIAPLREVISNTKTPAIVRATAIGLLSQYPSSENAQLINNSLDDESPLVRAAAVKTLSPNEQTPSRDHFIKQTAPYLNDVVRIVRLATAYRMVNVVGELTTGHFQERLEEAIQEFREGQEMHLDRASSHMNLATLEQRLGNLTAAIESLRLAIRQEPYLTGPRGELSRLLAAAGGDEEETNRWRLEEANLLKRDSELLPGNPIPHYQRGMLLYLLGESDKARRALAEACRLGPNDYQSWLALALICEQQERWKDATAVLKHMQKLRPNDPTPQAIYQRIQKTRQQKSSESSEESTQLLPAKSPPTKSGLAAQLTP